MTSPTPREALIEAVLREGGDAAYFGEDDTPTPLTAALVDVKEAAEALVEWESRYGVGSAYGSPLARAVTDALTRLEATS